MNVPAKIVTVLSGDGLIVYPLVVPHDGRYPCVVYQIISNPEERTHAGAVMERPRLQLSCWAKTYADCVTTAETVKAALDLNQTDFTLATRENQFDTHEEDTGYLRIILEYFVWNKEI